MMRRWALAMATLFTTPAAADPVLLARSAVLAVDVTAAGPDWCGPAPSFDLVAPTSDTFARPDLGGLVVRLGADLVGRQCPQAQRMQLRGMVRGQAAPAWLGTAEAASGWAVRPVVAAPLDLDQPATAAPPADGKPVPLGAAGRARAEAALGNLPGRWNAARRCWAASVRSPNGAVSACLSVVKGYTVPTPDGAAEIHLLLQGKGTTDCHACSGLSAFAVVTATGDAWHAASRPLVEPNGGYGVPTDPKSVTFARLGSARWGWIESASSFGQGFLEGAISVHLMRGGIATDAGTLPGGHSNGGACDEYGAAQPSCAQKIDYTVTATPDVSDPLAAAYPIILHAHGTLGRALDKQTRVPFDERKSQYVAPAAWP